MKQRNINNGISGHVLVKFDASARASFTQKYISSYDEKTGVLHNEKITMSSCEKKIEYTCDTWYQTAWSKISKKLAGLIKTVFRWI